jgi:hypothetical protein
VSVLDPVVDETSDWTLHVLGTIAGLTALVVSSRRGAAVAETQPLSLLGGEVLRLVESWRSGGSDDLP